MWGTRLLTLVIIVWASQPMSADVAGTILGTVTDSTGAVLPGVEVTLRNPETGLHRVAKTDSVGSYQFLHVAAGENYVVEVDAQGFRRESQSNIKLLVNQVFRADFRLQIGTAAQSVEVNGSPVQVDADTTQLGDVVDDSKMTALPLNGRSYIDLLGLQAGVVPVSSSAALTQTISGTISNSGALSVNGQRETANAFYVNGNSVEEGNTNTASVVPTLDSIQEFRLLTNSFDAEYGHFSGSVVNVLTKSGTNNFHGSVFEFLRNDVLDARSYFDPQRGVFKQNQFGGAIGGPLLKNRVFFFGDYQGTRQRFAPPASNITVPSAAERAGNFSDLGTTGFAEFIGSVRGDDLPGHFAQTISSRLRYTVNPGEPYWLPGCNTLANAQAGMCVFPGHIIPESAWSPAALGTLKFIPKPTGSLNGQPFFSTSGLEQQVRDDKWAQRIDVNTNSTGNWAVYYHFDDATAINPFAGGDVPGFAGAQRSRAQLASLSNTRNFGAIAVNEVRFAFTRVAFLSNQPTEGLGKVSSFGFVEGGLGIVPSYPQIEGVPAVSLNQLGVSFGSASPTFHPQNTFHVMDNFSKIIGKHTLKFGGAFEYAQLNTRTNCAINGSFGFAGGETGNDFADFLIGAPDSYFQCSRQFGDSRTKYGAIYGQDSYKATTNFTVNYGLRWEVSQPWYDIYGRLQTFVPGLQSQRFTDSPTGWVFPGDPGIPKTAAPTRYDNFAPRLGLAYSPSWSGLLGKITGGPGRTGIRAGTGIFYNSLEEFGADYELGDPPFGSFYGSPSLIYLEEPFKGRTSGNDPGQRFPYAQPGKNGSFAQFLPLFGAPGYKVTNRLPYAEDLNVNIQRQIGNSSILTVAYVATRGHHLFTQLDFNPGNAAECLQIAALFAAAGQAGAGCGPFGEDTIYTISGKTFYGTRPYSVTSGRHLSEGLLDFSDNTWESTSADSNYNAAEATFERRVGALRFLAAYTWSKALDDSSGFLEVISINSKVRKSLSAFDVTHNFVVSYSYDLPFGHLASASRVASKLLNGWQLSGITRFVTGFPITLSQSGDLSLCGCGTFGINVGAVDVPNYSGARIARVDPRTSPSHQWFDASVFSTEQLGVPGNARRRFFHGPGLNNWDLALQKSTRITEKTSAEFRAEFFNAFNHAQFTNPVGDVASSQFGAVISARAARIGQVALKLSF